MADSFEHSGRASADGSRPLSRFVSSQDRLEAIYVGHIAKDVSDELLKKVLLQCGTIVRWTRSRDPVADAPTSFGFCEFDSPEAVWRVTRLIDGLELGGGKLIVTCPQKTKELMEKWHSQRLFYLQKANPHWSIEQVEEEFAHDDERVMSIVHKIVVDIEEAIKKNRTERTTEELSRQARLQAMKARLNDKRDQQPAPKKPKPNDDEDKKNQQSGLPRAMLHRQQIRVDNVRARKRELDQEFDRRSIQWNQELPSIHAEGSRKWRRFEDVIRQSIPSRMSVIQMIQIDLRDVIVPLSVTHLESLGRSILYEFNGAELLDTAPRETDENYIPVSRGWQKRVLQERKRMRDVEKHDDYLDAQEELIEAELSKASDLAQSKILEAYHRKSSIPMTKPAADQQPTRRLNSPKAEEIQNRPQEIASVDDHNNHPAAVVDLPPPLLVPEADRLVKSEPVPVVIEWLVLEQNGYLADNGQLKIWVRERMADYVGKDDADELGDYIMDLLPPRASVPPTRASIEKELAELLDEETQAFVNELLDRLVSASV